MNLYFLIFGLYTGTLLALGGVIGFRIGRQLTKKQVKTLLEVYAEMKASQEKDHANSSG